MRKAIIDITDQMELDYALCGEDSDCEDCSCRLGADDCIFNYEKQVTEKEE